MSPKISRELAEHRLEQAKEEVVACEALYDLKLYKSATNPITPNRFQKA